MRIRELFTGRIYTVSNLLSVMRVLMVPIIGCLFAAERETGAPEYRYYSVLVLAVMLATDFFDGYLARVLNQVSRLGQFLDPLADKTALLILGALLYYYKDFPLWLLFIMAARDIYAVAGGFMLFSRRDIQARPNIFGKFMVASLGLTALVYILAPSASALGIPLRHGAIALVLFFLILSTIVYWKTYSKVYFETKR
jgi:CDP-diacylglycerol--glycerol-3-phosphate 3-phosphatidyltransferase